MCIPPINHHQLTLAQAARRTSPGRRHRSEAQTVFFLGNWCSHAMLVMQTWWSYAWYIYVCISMYISRCIYLDVYIYIYISVLIWYIVGVQCALFPFHSTPKQHSSWDNHDDHADSGSLRIWHTSGYTTKHRHLDTTWIYPTNPSKPNSQCGKLRISKTICNHVVAFKMSTICSQKPKACCCNIHF